MAADRIAITVKAVAFFALAFLFMGLALFVPAGTLDYWQAWVYIAVLLIPVAFVGSYFLVFDPAFIERRMNFKEKEQAQKKIVSLASVIFLIGFLLPGFDRRFGWSHLPFEAIMAADALVLLGYVLVFIVFNENRYAARTIRVEKGQTVISTGPYSIIRHPMYLGTLLIYLATPIALGSYLALPPFLLLLPILILRIRNEEEVLMRELSGYKEYCTKVRCRLVPFVW